MNFIQDKSFNNSLIIYLNEYLTEIKVSLPKKYNKLKKNHKKLEKFLINYTRKHPNRVALIQGSADDIHKQVMQLGGAKLEFNNDKMKNLINLFKYFKNLDLSESKKTIGEINKKISDIQDILKEDEFKLESYEGFKKIVSENKIINELELTKNKIEKLNDRLKVETKNVNYKKPKKTFIEDITKNTDINDKTDLDSVLDLLNKELESSYKSYKKITEADTESISKQIKNINEYIEKINILLKNSVEIKNKLKKYNELIDESLKFTYNKDEIFNPDVTEFENSKEKYSQQTSSNFVKPESNKLLKLNIGQIDDIVNNYTKYKNNTITEDIYDIYKPNFAKFDPDNNKENNKEEQKGGTNEEMKEEKKEEIKKEQNTIKDLERTLTEFKSNLSKYVTTHNELKTEITTYNLNQIYLTTHTLFYTLIITNQLFDEGYVVFNYINKGMMTFYHRIIKSIMKRIDNDDTDIIMYFKKYHYFTLKKLDSFLTELTKKTQAKEIIKILNCKGETSKRFLLLNYFKRLLEAYKVKYQSIITIYARINDIYDNGKRKKIIKFFEHDKEDTSLLKIMHNVCPGLQGVQNDNDDNNIKKIKFTEVFSTDDFEDNLSISKYMTLDTQLGNGNGVALMTYGYSGTGKTYTLFGNNALGKKGMLQSTLENINGLQEVKFRLYELYGYGLPYNEYWKDINNDNNPKTNDIKHELYSFNVSLSGEGLTLAKENNVGTKIIKGNEMKKYIDDNNRSSEIGNDYVVITRDLISDVFNKFDTFMTYVDDERERKNGEEISYKNYDIKKRIRDTPNNKVSSRSVLIFDFQLYINGKWVSFLIIDLPGRESIIETYIEPFFGKPDSTIVNMLKKGLGSINETTKNNKITEMKFLLATMALNPIAVPLFDSDIVFNYINEKNFKNMIDLVTKQHTLSFNDESILCTLLEERVSRKVMENTNDYMKLGDFFMVNGKKIKLIPTNSKLLGSKSNEENYKKSLLGVHVINKLFLINEDWSLRSIYDIFKLFVDKYINDVLKKGLEELLKEYTLLTIINNLITNGFKAELINQFKNNNNNNLNQKGQLNTGIKDKFLNLIYYDYYLTPLEGIYINENIMGILQYLQNLTKELGITQNNNENDIKIQDLEKNKFEKKQALARIWMSQSNTTSQSLADAFGIELAQLPNKLKNGNEFYNYSDVEKEYDNLKETYVSSKIFCDKKPLIQDILSYYIDKDTNNETKIKDFKIFYLFGNYEKEISNDLKCVHQNTLLNNTENFIKTITNN